MTVLQPILQILQNTTRCLKRFNLYLTNLPNTLRRAGLAAKVEALHSASNGDGLLAVERLLAGEDSVSEISVTFNMDLERW